MFTVLIVFNLKQVEVAIHVFHCHICSLVLSANFHCTICTIAMPNEWFNGRNLKLFIQDSEVYAGEQKGLS
jgi:hypothetical protein